jgi:hypothetical protein
MTGESYSPAQRRAAGAKQLLEAKILEFGAHSIAGNQAAAERARTEAAAALESHFDLTAESIAETMKRGW